jgi:imidazolonepropionase-like amidohydrolase
MTRSPSFFAVLLCTAAGAAQSETIVFTGARLIDGSGRPPVENSLLVVDGDRIVAAGPSGKTQVPQGARTIDLAGRTIMPGLINGHGHVGLVADLKNSADAYTRDNVTAQLAQYEQYGVTSVLTLGLNRDLVYQVRDEQRQGKLGGASLFTAGRGIGVPDAAPPVPVQSDQVYRPMTVPEAVAEVRETATHHADYLKIWVDDIFGRMPKMVPDVYKAAIDEAHKNNIRVAAHVFYLGDAKALVASGVDALAHSVRDQPVDAELGSAMKSKGTYYVPTLNVDESLFLFAEDPAQLDDPFLAGAVSPALLQYWRSPEYRDKIAKDPNTPKFHAAQKNAAPNLKALHDAGVRIGFGTDSGAQPVRVPGWAEHRELELMVRAGLAPMEAIVAATRGSAAMVGVDDRGTLEKGKRADFLVLSGDPLQDIRNTRKLVAIWHNGREIKPRVAVLASK